MSTQQTYTKVASVGNTLVAAQELLPVVGIVQLEKADVLLFLRGHDGAGAAVSNGSGGDGRIGRSSEGRNNLGIVIGIGGGCAECALPSGTDVDGLLVFGGRCRGNGCRREDQVRKCSVEPHYCCFGFVAFVLVFVGSVLFYSSMFGSDQSRYVLDFNSLDRSKGSVGNPYEISQLFICWQSSTS